MTSAKIYDIINYMRNSRKKLPKHYEDHLVKKIMESGLEFRKHDEITNVQFHRIMRSLVKKGLYKIENMVYKRLDPCDIIKRRQSGTKN